jgi:hypothetical protein
VAADPKWIAALEAELDGYRRAGRDDRAAEVIAELRKLGVTVGDPTPQDPKPVRRRKAS